MSGKRFPADTFYATKTPKEAEEEASLMEEFGKSTGAMDLETYCHIKGHSDPVLVAGMKAFTKITKATTEKWDEVFKTY